MAGGIVYLVGAGPGDPALVTARGLACIRSADVLVYDRLVSPALVARSRADAEKLYVGKEVGRHGRKQADISGLLAQKALEGKTVCRLKGGDPFVFGRGGEEAELLAVLAIPFEVVPGVTSGVAAPAFAGIPVTHRDAAGAVTLVTGHDAPEKGGPAVNWQALAAGNSTLLIYMGVEALPETAGRLVAHGRAPETPVAVIRWGTSAEQATVTGTLTTIAADVKAAGIKSPAMVVVGEVVRFREKLSWAERRPLSGRRLLVPVVDEEIPVDLVHGLRSAGAEVWEWPVASGGESRVDTAPLLQEALVDGAIDGVILTAPAVADLLRVVTEGAAPAVICVDDATASAAAGAGLKVEAVARTVAELVAELTAEAVR